MSPDSKALTAQAQSSRAGSRLNQAVDRSRRAVAAAPSSAVAEHNLAAALGDAGRWAEAEVHVRNAFAKGGAAPETWLVLGRCHQALGALDDAEQAFLQALQRRPTLYDAHLDLAQLRWMRTGESLVALAGIDRAILNSPADPRLSHVKAKILEGTGQIEEAYVLLKSLERSAAGDLAIAVYASQVASLVGDSSVAVTYAERAIALAPQDSVAAIALIIALLGAGDPARAEALAIRLHAQAPSDQHTVALLATTWRLLGDARYGALYDYDALVKTSFLDVPAGWSSLADYVDALGNALRRAHTMQTHPFNQSVRHASQVADILDIKDPAIAALPWALHRPITQYIANLGGGDDPLRKRNLGGYAFQGMWSIRMKAGGYHVDHVHPNGWISSACYVEAPDAGGGYEGWIRFGAPGVPTTPLLGAERFIKPTPGMVVLFPSYMWHGVVPYTQAGARMSLAFDLEPVAGGDW